MTPARQPHPQPEFCPTCNHWSTGTPRMCILRKMRSGAKESCTLHSSVTHTSPPAPNLDDGTSIGWTHAKIGFAIKASYQRGYDSGAKAARERVLDEMVKLSMMIETNETERWESCGRPKNDGYINGSHSGYGHALRDMRQWIDQIKKAESLRAQPEERGA
jgi:hypothetical protein